uniref:Uncharacterized protein n=1 Tax=Cannabis sativa TaxID=3483 RepID=A0A803Q8R2_CANSA
MKIYLVFSLKTSVQLIPPAGPQVISTSVVVLRNLRSSMTAIWSEYVEGVPDTLLVSREISSPRDLLAAETAVTIARHSGSIMARTKQKCRRAQPYDPHIAMLATRGRVGIVEEALVADRDEETSDSASEIEEVVPTRRQYKTCVVFPNNPLDLYDEAKRPLNSLGHLPEVGIYHVMKEAAAPRVLEHGDHQDRWISPLSSISTQKLNKIKVGGLMGDVRCDRPMRDQQAHQLAFKWMTWSECHIEQGAVLPLYPYYRDIAMYFRIRDRANYILSLPVERRNIWRLACETNFQKYEETCPGGGHTPNLDDDIPFSKLVRTMEKREKALHQCLTRGGTTDDVALLRDLTGEPFDRASSGHPKAKMAQIARGWPARYEPLGGSPARVALMRSWLARNAPPRG